MTNRPRRKQLNPRDAGAWPACFRATCVSGKSSRLLAGRLISAAPPTLTIHKVATANTNQTRSTRPGSLMRVDCHCQPPRLKSLKPPSIQARKPYQLTRAASGGRSVRMNQASWCAASRPASKVHRSGCVLKHVTCPLHWGGHGQDVGQRAISLFGRTKLSARIDPQKRMPA